MDIWALRCELTHHDSSLHLAIFSGVIGSVSQEPKLAFFGYKPAGEFSVSVSHHRGKISNNTYDWLSKKH